MADLDDMLARAKDQQAKLSRLDGSHDKDLWNKLAHEMLADLSHAKGPRADEFIECLARSMAFVRKNGEVKDAITKLWNEALTGDTFYQNRLGGIAYFLTGFLPGELRRSLLDELPKLDAKTPYGTGLVSTYDALKYGG